MMAHDHGNSDGGYSDDGNYSDEYEDDFEALESPEKPLVFGQPRPWLGPTSSLDLGAVDFSPPSAGVGSRASTESASSVLQATRGSVGGGGGGGSQQQFSHHPRHSSNSYAVLPVAESSLNGTDTSAGSYRQTGPNMPVLPEPMQRLSAASVAPGKVESPQRVPAVAATAAVATSTPVAGAECAHEDRGKGSLPPLTSPARAASASGAESSHLSPEIKSNANEAAKPAQPWNQSNSSNNAAGEAARGLPTATAHSAGGSAVLYPYHTQSMRTGFWKLGKKIGQGSFGTVHQGLNEDTGMAVAVKVLPRHQLSGGGGHGGNAAHAAQVHELENEIALMQTLDHPNIVRYLGCEASPTSLYIFQEWVPCGSVADLLKAYGPLSSAVLQRYLKHVLLGLAYLHEQRVVHRDVKGGNVLVNEFGVAKLADFGCSKRLTLEGTLGEASHSSGIKGTPYFMAPEVIKNDRAGRPSDIWSLGGVAFQMATGDPPWKSMQFKTPMVLFYHVVNSAGPPPLDDARISPQLANFLKRCFQLDPASRPSAAQLLLDPVLNDGRSGVSGAGVIEASVSKDSSSSMELAGQAGAAAMITSADACNVPAKQVVSTPGRPLPPSNARLEDHQELSLPLPPPASAAVPSPPESSSSVTASGRSLGLSGDGCESAPDGVSGEVGSEPDDDGADDDVVEDDDYDDDDDDDDEEDARSLSGSKEEFLGTDEEIAGIFARAAAVPRAPHSHDRGSSSSSRNRNNRSGEAYSTPRRSNSSCCGSVRSNSSGGDRGGVGRGSASGTSISSSGSSGEGGDDVGRGSSDRSQSRTRRETSNKSREGRPPLWRRSQSPSTSSDMLDGNRHLHVGQRQHRQQQPAQCAPEVPEEEEEEEGCNVHKGNSIEEGVNSSSSSRISQPRRLAGNGKHLSPSSASNVISTRGGSASRPSAAPGSQSGKHGLHTGYGQHQLRKGERSLARPAARREISPAAGSGRRASPARVVASAAPPSAAAGSMSSGGGAINNSRDNRSRDRPTSLRGGSSTPLQRRSGERKWGLNGYQPQAQQKHRAATAPTSGASNEAIVRRSPGGSSSCNNGNNVGADSRAQRGKDPAHRNVASSSKSPNRSYGVASAPACSSNIKDGNGHETGQSKPAEPPGAAGRAQPSERRPLTSLLRFKERMQDPDRRSRQWAEGAE